MKVEIKEVAVVTRDDGSEVLVWDRAFVDEIRSLGVTLPPSPAKGRRSNRTHKPKPESQSRINADKPKHNAYGTRPCTSCGQTFSPRSGRAKVCDDCRKAGVLRKRPAADKSKTNPAVEEVRELAAAANIGQYGKGRDGDAS